MQHSQSILTRRLARFPAFAVRIKPPPPWDQRMHKGRFGVVTSRSFVAAVVCREIGSLELALTH